MHHLRYVCPLLCLRPSSACEALRSDSVFVSGDSLRRRSQKSFYSPWMAAGRWCNRRMMEPSAVHSTLCPTIRVKISLRRARPLMNMSSSYVEVWLCSVAGQDMFKWSSLISSIRRLFVWWCFRDERRWRIADRAQKGKTNSKFCFSTESSNLWSHMTLTSCSQAGNSS